MINTYLKCYLFSKRKKSYNMLKIFISFLFVLVLKVKMNTLPILIHSPFYGLTCSGIPSS